MPFSPTSGIDRLSFLAHNDMYPGSQIDKNQYAVSSQYPTSAQAVVAGYDPRVNPLTGEQTQHMAKGGIASLASGGEIQAAYRQYLGRDPEEGAYAAWANADPGALIAGITGSQEYANRQGGGGGGIYAPDQPAGPITLMPVQGGGGDIDALFRQYLNRSPDQGAYQTYAGWSPDQIRQAILGSQEFANLQASGGGGGGGGGGAAPSGGGDIDALYRQYLGRAPDQGAYQTYAGWSPDQIRNAILGSQEYANRQGGGGAGGGGAAKGDPQALAQEVFNLYRTNQNYDKQLNALNALPQDADYYKARIGLIGKMMGWQAGQGTADRNSVYQKELESYLPGAAAAGVKTSEINDLINSNMQTQAKVNAERIASDAKGAHGWIDQNLGQGVTSALKTAGTLAAAYFLPGIGGPLFNMAANLVNQADDNYTAPSRLSAYKVPGSTTGSTGTEGTAGTTRTTAATSSNPLSDLLNRLGIGSGSGTSGGSAGGGTPSGVNVTSLNLGGDNAPTTQSVPLFQVGTPSALAGSTLVSNPVAQQAAAQQVLAQQLPQPEIYEPDFEFARGGIARMAGGGHLGGYSDGGRLLKGPGDGMSDNIPASIAGKQPARLADGEFVIPADVVSHLGNGSTDAGAKQLYAMMNKIRKARTGSSKQGKQINAAKFLPKG